MLMGKVERNVVVDILLPMPFWIVGIDPAPIRWVMSVADMGDPNLNRGRKPSMDMGEK